MTVKQNGNVESRSSIKDHHGVVEQDPRKVIAKKEELHGKVTFWLALSTFITSAGAGAQLGFNAGVMTVAAPFVLEFLNHTNYDKWGGNVPDRAITGIYSCTVSVYSVGGALAAIAAGRFSDSLGRKYSLVACSVLSVLAGILMGVCQKADIFGLLFLGRFTAGLNAGFSMVILPIYLAEISPVNLRGATGVFGMLMVCSGTLVSHVIGFFALYNQQDWPILLSLIGVLGALVIIVFPFCPESPRWLFLHQRKRREAEIALRRLRGASADITAELEEMETELQQEELQNGDNTVTVMDILRLKNPEWKFPLILNVASTLAFMLSGTSALFFYTTEIFEAAGLEQTEIAYATVAYSSVNVIFTVIGVLIVDKVGRRPLLLYPFVAGLVCLVGMTISIETQDKLDWMKWATIAIVYLFTAILAIGPFCVKNLICAELWLQRTRPAGMSIMLQATWWAMAIVALTFPLLNSLIGGYTFLIFFACLLVSTIILFRYLPETKDKTFQEITAHFVKSPASSKENHFENAMYNLEGCVNGIDVKETELVEETPTRC